MEFKETVQATNELHIRQKRELAEFIGFETRNKYVIETKDGEPVGFAAEQQKGIAGFLMRQLLGHWRSYTIQFFDMRRNPVLEAVHPFRFFFQRLEIRDTAGTPLGALQQRFAILSKRFDVVDPQEKILMSVRSPFWRIWTFVFQRGNRDVARIEKKWAGIFSEVFTDKDRFRLKFEDPAMPERDRLLLVAAALFVDLQYFEKKAD